MREPINSHSAYLDCPLAGSDALVRSSSVPAAPGPADAAPKECRPGHDGRPRSPVGRAAGAAGGHPFNPPGPALQVAPRRREDTGDPAGGRRRRIQSLQLEAMAGRGEGGPAPSESEGRLLIGLQRGAVASRSKARWPGLDSDALAAGRSPAAAHSAGLVESRRIVRTRLAIRRFGKMRASTIRRFDDLVIPRDDRVSG